MADRGHGWRPLPHHPEGGLLPEQASWFEPAPQQPSFGNPPPIQSPWTSKPRWYRRAWFVGLVVIVVFGALGAILGSRVG
jgi:hypothetical protein